jgi:predicted NAD-dependent protein-ADP-ribosyltransferase YbiA (DUF1768 family)
MIDARHDHALAFLRQDYPAPITVQGLLYASVAHAILAAQTVDPEVRSRLAATASLDEARRVAVGAPIRDDWDAIEDRSVWYLVRLKFTAHPELAEQLLDLPPDAIVAATDPYWGLDDEDDGENRLGGMLACLRGRALVAYAERVLGPLAPATPSTGERDNLSLFNACA